MEPTQAPITTLATILQQRWILRALDLLAGAMVLLALFLLYVTFGDYRSIQFKGLPGGAIVAVNGHKLTTMSVKLRPSVYDVTITSPTTAPYDSTLSVGLFSDQVVTPKLAQRSINAIASSLLGATPETSGAPQMDQLEWFSSNTWVVGILGPTDTVLALHYDTTKYQWVVAYCDSDGYPSDTASLPPEVTSYVQSLLSTGDH